MAWKPGLGRRPWGLKKASGNSISQWKGEDGTWSAARAAWKAGELRMGVKVLGVLEGVDEGAGALVGETCGGISNLRFQISEGNPGRRGRI